MSTKKTIATALLLTSMLGASSAFASSTGTTNPPVTPKYENKGTTVKNIIPKTNKLKTVKSTGRKGNNRKFGRTKIKDIKKK